MVVYLDLTEKTIDCFNECARKGSYAKFVDENQKFIRTLSDNLKKVKFAAGETISDMVSQNCKFYIDYLIKWNPREPRGVVPGTAFLERYTPKLVNDLKRAISIRNWDKFYWEYYPTADFIINEARKQGVLDFQIQKGSGSYESFHERDFVVTNMQRNTEVGIRDHHNTPVETKNSKEMILKVEEYPKSHQSGNNHSIHYSGNDGQTIICIEDPRATPTKNDNVRKTLIPSQRAHIDNRHTTSPLCSDHSTNGLHGSKKSDYLNRSENSPGIPLRNIPISEQPPVDQLPKSSHQRTSSTPYVKLPPLQNSSLHDRYKDPTLNSTHRNQHVHNTTKTTRTSQIHRPAQVPLPNVPKQNPQGRYSTPTRILDSEHTMIPSEHKPGFSADDALQNREFQGTRERLFPYKDTSSSNAPHNQHVHDTTITNRTSHSGRNAREPVQDVTKQNPQERCSGQSRFNTFGQDRAAYSANQESPMVDNLAFDIELAKQNLRNAQELEAKREERKKKQKEFDEELKTLKEESKQRFQMLLKCIMLKRRFEEQEQHWMDWIAGCRHSIASFLNRWYDFYDDVEKSHRGFRRPEIVDLYELQRDTGHFLNSIMVTFNVMECDFEHMKRIGSAHPDTLFVKVLMKCIADIAHELIRIYNFTQSLGTDQSKFLELQSMMARVNPNKILSTDQLRSICRTVNDALQDREFPGTRELLFPYKDTSSSNAPHNQHVHDTTITNRTSHSGRNAREPVQDVTKQNPQERCSGQSPFYTFGQDSQHTMIQSEYKPGFSADDALQNRKFQGIWERLFSFRKLISIRKLRHLENFNPQYPGNSGQGTYGAGSVRETINDDMKDAILGMNWDSFYEKYIPYVDEIIDAAREQKVIFVCIEHESCWYPNFSSRLSSDADTNSETTSDKELDETNSGGNEAGNNSNSSDTDPDRCVETEDVHRKPETMKTEIQADLESYKNHIDTQIENFEAAKNDLKKEMEQKVVQLESEIKCSLSKTTDANQQKVDELQNEIQQKMDDLKLYLEEKIENHVTILKQVVSDNLKELDSKIEEKVEKKFEELQNELRTRKEESDRELEERLKQMIAVTVEKRLEEKFEEMRNEKNESERKIRERFEKASGRSQAQKDSSMNSETSEVPDGEEIKSETSGGSVDDDQHGSGSSISVETTPAANGEEHVDQQINEQEQDPEGTEQDHVSDVSEGSISVESITAIGMKRIAQEVSDLDVEPDGVNQEPQGSSEESEEEDIEQLLAQQDQFYEEKFKKIRDARIQKKQKEEEELEEMAANMRARYSFR